jgi:hypothetical protein
MKVNFQLRSREWIAIVALILALMGLAVAEHFVLDGMLTGLMLVLGFSVTILLLFQNRQEIIQNRQCILKNRKDSVSHFEQTEALLGIYSAFSGKTPPPLPKTRGWAASPDFLKVVHKKIKKGGQT